MTLAKFWTALSGALAVAASLAADGLTDADWITIVMAFVTAAGVYAMPNAPKGDGG